MKKISSSKYLIAIVTVYMIIILTKVFAPMILDLLNVYIDLYWYYVVYCIILWILILGYFQIYMKKHIDSKMYLFVTILYSLFLIILYYSMEDTLNYYGIFKIIIMSIGIISLLMASTAPLTIGYIILCNTKFGKKYKHVTEVFYFAILLGLFIIYIMFMWNTIPYFLPTPQMYE